MEHNEGRTRYTSSKRPWDLFYMEEYNKKGEAIRRERLEGFILKYLDGFAGPDVP